MSPDLAFYLEQVRAAGVRFEVEPGLVEEEAPLEDFGEEMRPVELPGIAPFVEHRDPAQELGADAATFAVARVLLPRIELGARFWDIGCGTGVLCVAAGLKGASAIVATDLDARAITLARRTAADANVNIRFCQGADLDAVPPNLGADVVAVRLPAAAHPKFAAAAAQRLQPGTLVGFPLLSLPDPRLLQSWAVFHLSLAAFLPPSGAVWLART